MFDREHLQRTWHDATRSKPCPVCGGTSWCASTDAATYCRRSDSDGNGEAGRPRPDKHGIPGWLYFHEGGAVPAADFTPRPMARRAAPHVLNRAYRRILGLLPAPTGERLEHLLARRGVTEAVIHEIGLREVSRRVNRLRVAAAVADELGLEEALAVPGIYLRECRRGKLPFLGGYEGIIIPCQSLAREVLALKVRVLDPAIIAERGKYFALSSSYHGGPKAEPMVHVPAHRPADARTVRVTEGELKAEIAQRLTGVLTISIPGVDFWNLAMPVLRELAPERVLVAFDGDWRTNPNVGTNLRDFVRALRPEASYAA